MEILPIIYYIASVMLWLFLTVLAVMAIRPGFPEWLISHPRFMIYLLGTNQLPEKPAKTLRRFYLFLDGGWTWLLVWSWWLMPWVKDFFFRSINTPASLKIARISAMIVIIAYAAAGFFAIGKAITIWFKEIYKR